MKGLTADGSTRSWRRVRAMRKARDQAKGTYRCAVCGTTTALQLDHKVMRRNGGTDASSNLGKWYCPKHNPGVGRPRGS